MRNEEREMNTLNTLSSEELTCESKYNPSYFTLIFLHYIISLATGSSHDISMNNTKITEENLI
jgi:hypothetical protein